MTEERFSDLLGNFIDWRKESVGNTNLITLVFEKGEASKLSHEFAWDIRMNDGYSLHRHLDRLYVGLDIQRVAMEAL